MCLLLTLTSCSEDPDRNLNIRTVKVPERYAVCPSPVYLQPVLDAAAPVKDDIEIADIMHWARDERAQLEKANRKISDLKNELNNLGCDYGEPE